MARDPLIYALTDPDGAVRYIGKSVNGLVRARKHFQPAQMRRKCHRNSWLQSLQAQGKHAGVEVLERFADASDLNDAERYWIAQGTGLEWRLTNHTKGGDGNAFAFGNKYAQGIRKGAVELEAMRERMRALWRDPSYRERVMAARVPKASVQQPPKAQRSLKSPRPPKVQRPESPRSPRDMSASMVALWADPLWRASVCAKLSASAKKRVISAEGRARLSAARKGRVVTAETRSKISASQKGREFSAEHRAKLSAAGRNTKHALGVTPT